MCSEAGAAKSATTNVANLEKNEVDGCAIGADKAAEPVRPANT